MQAFCRILHLVSPCIAPAVEGQSGVGSQAAMPLLLVSTACIYEAVVAPFWAVLTDACTNYQGQVGTAHDEARHL